METLNDPAATRSRDTRPYAGTIAPGHTTFAWGDLGRCIVSRLGVGVVKFRSVATGVQYQVSEKYWRRTADDVDSGIKPR